VQVQAPVLLEQEEWPRRQVHVALLLLLLMMMKAASEAAGSCSQVPTGVRFVRLKHVVLKTGDSSSFAAT
jgi:hypothetical protein